MKKSEHYILWICRLENGQLSCSEMELKMQDYKIRTDLALEINEDVCEKDSRYSGVIVRENEDENTGIKVTLLRIINSDGERIIGKQKGNYITIEASELDGYDDEYTDAVTAELSLQLHDLVKQLMGRTFKNKEKNNFTILVAGLGNREVTADSLGPKVVDNLIINRHYLMDDDDNIKICAVCPGVMAQTGMETAQIIKGIAENVKPDIVIAIDALAARNTERLNTTIQLSDTGINPGSGVGNHRVGITKENIGVPVIAVGVPTVIDASTIVCDAVSRLDMIKDMSEERKRSIVRDAVGSNMKDMYVTPKDIDANINLIGRTVAYAINMLNL